jgi:uncharacterized protein YdbL (DUF1318 family)
MKKFIAALLLTFALQTAWAIDLRDAKEQGLVGEANSGYLAAVKRPVSDEVQTLINEVNAKRLAEFERAAAKTDATVAQVSYRFYELAVERTSPGHYYEDKSGDWQKK